MKDKELPRKDKACPPRKIGSNFLTSLAFTAALTPLSLTNAAADILCYQTSALKSGNHAEVRIFNKSCPKGFSPVSKTALSATLQTVSAKFKGPLGPAGAPGAQGAIGIQGDAGIKGAPGIEGPKGDQGSPGPIGDQGDNPPGDPGAKGTAGIGTDQLFRFSGSSGGVPITPNHLTPYGVILQPNSVQKSTYLDFQDARTSAPLLGTSCSKIAYFAEISTAPGRTDLWTFSFIAGDPATPSGEGAYSLCDISGDATSCSGTADISVSAIWAATVAFKGSNDALAPTKAHWSLECLAS